MTPLSDVLVKHLEETQEQQLTNCMTVEVKNKVVTTGL